jgi:hypothetical protein
MRQFLVFPYPEEAGLAPSGAAGVARDGKDEKTAPMEAVGCILTAAREGKMGILVQLLDHSAEGEGKAASEGITYTGGFYDAEDVKLMSAGIMHQIPQYTVEM